MNNNQSLLILITISIIFFVFILPNLEKQINQEQNELKEQFENLSFNTATINDKTLHKVDQKICSKQCCKFTQWPVNFNTNNPNNNFDTSKYIGSNFSCNNGHTGGGCVCYETSDNNYLATHGQNN